MSTSAATPTTDVEAKKATLSGPRPVDEDENDGPTNDGGAGDAISRPARIAFGCYLILISIALMYVLLKIWPEKPASESVMFFGRWSFAVAPERRYFVIVIIAGALGSFIHLATSFADFVGNRRLMPSWIWWYILRPFIGVALALLFYFVFRGGLMTASSSSTEMSVFGIAAVSGLAGMFSKQVTDKLREICDTAFTAVKSSPPRADALKDDGTNGRVAAVGAGN